MKLKRFGFLGIIPIVIILFFYGNTMSKTKGKLDFVENLDAVAVTVDGEDITLKDLTFYVLFQEQKVEELARIYNPDNSKDYWNTHTNGEFVEIEARHAVLYMAIHDHIMYKLASEEGVVLSSDEKDMLEKARTKFWGSLFEEQLERLPLEYEEGNRIMKNIAIIEAYEEDLVRENPEMTVAGLGWDGYDYEKILKEHHVKINRKIWDRVVLGDISLYHDNVNFINGITDEEKEEMNKNQNKSLRKR